MKRIATELKDFLRALSKQTGISPRKLILLIFGAGFLVMIIIPIVTFLIYFGDLTSKENILTAKNKGVILLDRDDQPFFTLYDAREHTFVESNQIAQNAKEAVVAVEDKDFYKHPGFSVSGYGRAIVQNLTNRDIVSGGSTVSQQLVKNALLTARQSYLRKYQELFLALEIDRRYTKDEILEMYLNTAYFGEGAYGIENAAQVYFGKKASELTLAESAMMAAILPAPSAYSPLTGNAQIAKKRQALVLRLMREQGYITSAEEEQALKEELSYAEKKDNNINDIATHFALMVKEQLIEKYGEQKVAQSGFTVKTTLKRSWQEYAEETVKNQVERLVRNNATNGSAVIIDPQNGEVMALVGSHDWFDTENGKINMVLQPRQPGSSFKPLMYAAAFEKRVITPGTILEDKPIDFGNGYKPKNYDGRFRGPVLPRRALANSLNIPALLVMEKLGVSNGVEFAKKLGITSLDTNKDYGLPIVLGAAEVPLIEMAGAFATFANEGEYIKPTTILEIRDKKGKIEYTYEPESNRVLDAPVAYQISNILSDNAARAEVFGGSLTVSRPAAVKTGTTEDYRDALTIGYTPNIVVGVWVGNNDRTPMDSVAGSSGAGPIWRSLMNRFLSELKNVPFRKPLGIREIRICKNNGLKAHNESTESAALEYFLSGTEPDEFCDAASPTPTPSEQPQSEEEKKKQEEEQKKREEEERRKQEEERNRNLIPLPTSPLASPTPTEQVGQSLSPTPTPTLSVSL